MELTLHSFSCLRRLFPLCNIIAPYTEIQCRSQARSSITCRNSNRRSLILSEKEEQQQQLWRSQPELDFEDEEGEEEMDLEDDEYDTSSILSLSEKPDRNTALLDDDETEELDYASHPDHKSGQSLF